ncbi:MAG: LysR substrate-binding domain-containing protein [Rhodobacteraceae bacterium]|nr:LysR substrate-binding domain-containing protein [Paracoccaceae bacterium]
MSIRALRTLIAVRRHGTFRQAAEVEHLTPSAVSHQMKQLEETWGLELFDRTLKTPKLTQAGLTLVEEAEGLVAAYDNLPAKVMARDELSGELILGAVPTTLVGLVPRGLAQLKALHPDIRVRIVPGLTNDLFLQLARGQIDGAILSKPDVLPRGLHLAEIISEDFVLLAPKEMSDETPRDLLRTEPFIRFTRDAVVGRQIEAWLQKRGITVTDAMELDGLDAISSMVAAGLGVSIVPRSIFAAQGDLPVARLTLEDTPPRRIIGLVNQANTSRSRMIDATRHALLQTVENAQGTAAWINRRRAPRCGQRPFAKARSG